MQTSNSKHLINEKWLNGSGNGESERAKFAGTFVLDNFLVFSPFAINALIGFTKKEIE